MPYSLIEHGPPTSEVALLLLLVAIASVVLARRWPGSSPVAAGIAVGVGVLCAWPWLGVLRAGTDAEYLRLVVRHLAVVLPLTGLAAIAPMLSGRWPRRSPRAG